MLTRITKVIDKVSSFWGTFYSEYHLAHDYPISHTNTHLVNDYPISYTNTPILHTISTHLVHDYFFNNSVKLELKARNPVQQSDLPSRIFLIIVCKMSQSPLYQGVLNKVGCKRKRTPIVSKSESKYGAGDRGRTGTLLPARDFKSLASAYSATPASVSETTLSI